MQLVQPSVIVERPFSSEDVVFIERVGRTCYRSEDRITQDSAAAFVGMLNARGHHAMLEHVSATVRFITDRGVTHELVRHRVAAYAQESTRYCNYSKGKFGSQNTVIEPWFWDREGNDATCRDTWRSAMEAAEQAYLGLLALGASPQEARSVLPNSLKAEIVMTANAREWLHVLQLRTSTSAHPQMRQVMVPLARLCAREILVIFGVVAANLPDPPATWEASVEVLGKAE